MLSHELRGPLGVMQGYLRLLLTRRADDAADVRMLTAILEASGRITAIARDASELATWQDGRAFEHLLGGLVHHGADHHTGAGRLSKADDGE